MKPHITLIRDIVVQFDTVGVEYCLLRNYDFLVDEKTPKESLDIVISVKSFVEAQRIFLARGFVERRQQFSLRHRAFFKLVNLEMVSFDVQVGGVYWNDMAYLSEDIFLRRVKKHFFYTLSDNDTFVMLIAHSILGKRYFKEKYQRVLRELVVDEGKVVAGLSRVFGGKRGRELFLLARNGQCSEVAILPLVLLFLVRKPRRFFTFSALFFRWVDWKKPLKLAPLISIIGPDGAGKSSMVEALRWYLEKNGRKVRVVYTGRGKGHFLPMSWFGRHYKWREMKRDEQRVRSAGKIEKLEERVFVRKVSVMRRALYTLMAPVFALDLYLRYVFYILPQRRGRKIVITDRYGTDIMLMRHVPLVLKKFLYWWFPKPNLKIYLYNSVEVLHARRPREPILELQRQLALFDRFEYDLRFMTQSEKEDQKKVLEFVFRYLLREWY